MRKVFLFFVLIVIAMYVTSCSSSDDEDRNPLIGTWKGEDAVFESINGGTWYFVMDFEAGGILNYYHKKTDGTVKYRTDGAKYKITSTNTFTTYGTDGTTKIGDYVIEGNTFKSASWASSLYYITFTKQ